MSPRKRKRNKPPPPPRSGPVAWIALFIALLALALALSEKPWIQTRAQTISRNLDQMVDEIQSAAQRTTPDAASPEHTLAQAAEAARAGEARSMDERLGEGIAAVRERAETIGGDLSRLQRQVARDLERLRDAGEATDNTAQRIEDLVERLRELQPDAPDTPE